MHPAALNWVAQVAPARPVSVLDIGGRDINGHPGHLFDPRSKWEVVDLHDGPRVTWVGDILAYLPEDRFDLALCLEVAEHTAEWPEILEHAAELLVDDGQLIFTAAGPGRDPHSAIDGGSLRDHEHYANVSPDDLAVVLERLFRRHRIDVLGPDVRATAWEPIR